MPATLTPEQIAELEGSGGSLWVIENPQTHQGYVLVPREAYLQAKSLFEAVIRQAETSSAARSQGQSATVEWNDDKNVRRCALIDKKRDAGLSDAEQAELERLQSALAAHQRTVAPRPLAILELLEEALRHHTHRLRGELPDTY